MPLALLEGHAGPQARLDERVALLAVAVQRDGLEARAPARHLPFPVGHGRLGHEDDVRARAALRVQRPAQQGNGLQRLAKAHLVSEDAVEAMLVQADHPVKALQLVLACRGGARARARARSGEGGQSGHSSERASEAGNQAQASPQAQPWYSRISPWMQPGCTTRRVAVGPSSPSSSRPPPAPPPRPLFFFDFAAGFFSRRAGAEDEEEEDEEEEEEEEEEDAPAPAPVPRTSSASAPGERSNASISSAFFGPLPAPSSRKWRKRLRRGERREEAGAATAALDAAATLDVPARSASGSAPVAIVSAGLRKGAWRAG